MNIELLKEYLDYDGETGIFRWKKSTAFHISEGKIAGCWSKYKTGEVRLKIKVLGKMYNANRIAYAFTHGPIPPGMVVDHADRDTMNNKISNLRLATKSENAFNRVKQKNNTSGFKGVSRNRDRWRAIISENGNFHHIGTFDTPELAHQAYAKAQVKYHGSFSKV